MGRMVLYREKGKNVFSFKNELKEKEILPGIDHITGNIGCDCPAVKLMVDWRHDCYMIMDDLL